MKAFRENLLKYGSCLIIFLLPILYLGNKVLIYSYITSKVFFFYALVEILFAFWVYSVITDRSYRLSRKTLLYFIPLGAYLVWLTIAGILGANPALSFWSSFGRDTGLLTLYHCLAFALIVASLVQKNGIIYLHKFMQWFLNGGFVLAISIWCGNEGLNMFSFLKDSNGGGLMGNSSLAATYLLFTMTFGFFLLFSNQYKGNKWWLGTKIAVILFSPIFINILGLFNGQGLLGSARGTTLGIIVMVGVVFLTYLFFSEKKVIKTISIIGIILGIIIFSIGWAQLINPNTKLHQKFVESVSSTRFIFWNSAQKALNEHPWLGFGPENYMIAFHQNFDPRIMITNNPKDVHGDETWTDRAHNIYYDVGVSGGYPAIFLYFLFIFSILYALYKLQQNHKFNHLQIAILVGLVIGYVFQNLFVFDSLHSLMALFVLAGITFAYQDFLVKEKYLPVFINSFTKNTVIVFLAVACLILIIFFTYRPFEKCIAYSRITNMWVDKRPSHYADLLQGSSMGEQLDTSSMAIVIVVHYANNMVEIKNDKEFLPYAEKDLTAISQYLEAVVKTNKTDARLYLTLVDSYTVEISLTDKPYDPTLSKHLFDLLNQAEKLSPMNPEVYWDMARVYAWSLDIKNTEKEYQKAIDVGPTVPQSHQFLISFSKWVNDQKIYSSALLQAQKDIPGFIFSN